MFAPAFVNRLLSLVRGRSAGTAGMLCSFDAHMLPAHRNASLPFAFNCLSERHLPLFLAVGNLPSVYSNTTGFCRASWFDVPSLPRTAWKYESTILRLLMAIDKDKCPAGFDSVVSDHLRCHVRSCALARCNACSKFAVLSGYAAMSFSLSWMAAFFTSWYSFAL